MGMGGRAAEVAAPRAAFDAFVERAAPGLRRALVVRYGVEVGVEACADALAYGWEHWDRLADLANPAGYLYRVGQSSARRHHRLGRRVVLPPEAPDAAIEPEPGLADALAELTDDQRVAVVLVHGYGYPYAEAGDLLGIPVTTLRNHVHRGMARLRTSLEVER